ncbi:MAG TPA: hypothetical protein VJ570_11740, partial [Holophagaceae bacterium]|nr:hypothetical protein [Holophagaceae bacterium]
MTTRRSFLKGLGAAGAALGGFTACGGGGGGSSSGGPSNPPPPPPPPPVNQPILVSVYLEGGVDWLNLLVPNAGGNVSAYGAARPSLAIPLSAATDLGSGVSLNNDFTGFAALHAAGRVAWVPGIGMPGPTLSHFSAKDLWAQSGVLNGTGWLGRFADTAFVAGGDPLRGIVTTPDVPTTFKGSTRSFASIPASTGFVFPSTLTLGKVGAPYGAQTLEDAWGLSLTTVGTDPVSLAAHTAVRGASKAFFDGQNAFGTDGTLPYRAASVTYPGGSLSAQLTLIAQMIATGIPGQIYGARLGGFDTHGDQAGVLPGLLRESGGALKAFW